jgi:predicted GIY-YIG superfamily endonuclease
MSAFHVFRWKARSLTATALHPIGAWARTTDRRAKMHLIVDARAIWVDGQPSALIATKCVGTLENARLHVDIDDAEQEACDHCLMRGPAVYRFFDAAGRLLYVGYTTNPIARMRDHRNAAEWWPKVTAGQLESFATETEGLAAERAAIEVERPIHNKTYANKRPSADLVSAT